MKAFFVAIGAFCACCSARVPAWAAPPANQAAADNVCSYIAAAYNRGDRDKLWGYPDPVDIAGDGKLRHIYIIEQGTAHVSSIIASTSALSPEEQQAAFSSEVNFYVRPAKIWTSMPCPTSFSSTMHTTSSMRRTPDRTTS
jgi:hypothetical protein